MRDMEVRREPTARRDTGRPPPARTKCQISSTDTQAIGVETGGAELHARVIHRTARQVVGDRAIEVVDTQASPATGSDGSRVGVVSVDYPVESR